jgi:hypothetical protein
MQAFPNQLVVKGSKNRLRVEIEAPEMYTLSISCDAPDEHPVDGIPEIKADGKSFTTITLQKLDSQGKPRSSNADNDQLYLRIDHGILHSEDGREEINSITLKRGKAALRLTSETVKRIATIQIFNADPNFSDAYFSVEFI